MAILKTTAAGAVQRLVKQSWYNLEALITFGLEAGLDAAMSIGMNLK
jgi:hypothetical protein